MADKVEKNMQEYFSSIGVNPNIARNEFGLKEALQTFTKAGDELKKIKDNQDLATSILDKAWEIFKLLT